MADSVQVLVVEDEPQTIDLWKQVFETERAQGSLNGVNDLYANNLPSALAYLETHRIDATIVDLRLADSAGILGNNEDGFKFLRAFQQRTAGVAAVLSGQTSSELKQYAKDAPANTLALFDKGTDGQEKAMEWLKQQIAVIRTLSHSKRTIDERLAELFSRSIWPRWQSWSKDNARLQAAITRHMVAHLYAVLLEEQEHRVHREEWYFVPPVRSGIRTGDVLRFSNGTVKIVITPKCDLARAPKLVHLLECADAPKLKAAEKELDQALLAELSVPSENKKAAIDAATRVSNAQTQVRALWSNSAASIHYLPSLTLDPKTVLGPFEVSFGRIETIVVTPQTPLSTLESLRIAALTPDFLPTFVSRFAAYFSRFGHLEPLG